MPQRKKAKSSHHSGAARQSDNADITHDEIWDDSALLRSWDAAVKEYEYYHSLAAQGLDVDAVLDEAEAAEANGEPLPLGLGEPAESAAASRAVEKLVRQEDDAEEGEIDEGDNALSATAGAGAAGAAGERMPTVEERQAALQRAGLLSKDQAGDGVAEASKKTTQPALAMDGAPPPLADQTMENIKMAYYWAGYYSGLYDGQRQSPG